MVELRQRQLHAASQSASAANLVLLRQRWQALVLAWAREAPRWVVPASRGATDAYVASLLGLVRCLEREDAACTTLWRQRRALVKSGAPVPAATAATTSAAATSAAASHADGSTGGALASLHADADVDDRHWFGMAAVDASITALTRVLDTEYPQIQDELGLLVAECVARHGGSGRGDDDQRRRREQARARLSVHLDRHVEQRVVQQLRVGGQRLRGERAAVLEERCDPAALRECAMQDFFLATENLAACNLSASGAAVSDGSWLHTVVVVNVCCCVPPLSSAAAPHCRNSYRAARMLV